jgi:hypothetical protein
MVAAVAHISDMDKLNERMAKAALCVVVAAAIFSFAMAGAITL